MKVKDCMCNSVCSVTPDTKIKEVAKLMSENHVGSILVTDNNDCLCGIVTDRDIILRTIACDKDVKETEVSEIMTTNVCGCKEDDEMSDAESKMSRFHIRRLPVCDTDNKVIGILTLGDIAQNTREVGKDEVCQTVEKICDCNTEQNAE